MTNFERIKNMSIEEMAKVLDIISAGICKNFPECLARIGSENPVTDDDCNACAVRWLMEEAIE